MPSISRCLPRELVSLSFHEADFSAVLIMFGIALLLLSLVKRGQGRKKVVEELEGDRCEREA